MYSMLEAPTMPSTFNNSHLQQIKQSKDYAYLASRGGLQALHFDQISTVLHRIALYFGCVVYIQ